LVSQKKGKNGFYIAKTTLHHKKQLTYITLSHHDGLCNMQNEDNFGLDLISIKCLHIKLWAPKIARVPTLGILGLPLGSPGTKCHLDVDFVAKHRVYYKWEGGGFPQVGAVVNLMTSSLPVACPTTKSALAMH
jgi:hypothetical protein